MWTVKHKSAEKLGRVEPVRVEMRWRTRRNKVDYAIFCMRHMETYMGDKTLKWDCGLPKESQEKIIKLVSLHRKYLAEILLSDINMCRKKIIGQAEKLAKKSSEEIQKLLKKGWEKKDNRI